MAFEGVPWAVENGAKTGAEVARILAYAATQGAQGVVLPGDCKVTQTTTASGQVSIASGGLVVLNQQAPGQSYIGAAIGQTLVSIDPTLGSPRSDMVIARVVDPDYSPWQAADVPDPVNGPYLQPHILKGVAPGSSRAASVVTYSAVELARIDIPANTSTITAGMVHDLREVANPRRTEFYTRMDMTYAPDDMGSAEWVPFPNVSTQVPVPKWATEAIVRLDITGVQALNSAAAGHFRAYLGGQLTALTYFNEQNPSSARNAYVVGSKIAIPASMRGTTVPLRPEAMRNGGTGILRNEIDTQVVCAVTFLGSAA